MIITITPGPEETDPSGYVEDAAAIATAVERVGGARGWRVTSVQVWDELEGAVQHVPTPHPADEESDPAPGIIAARAQRKAGINP